MRRMAFVGRPIEIIATSLPVRRTELLEELFSNTKRRVRQLGLIKITNSVPETQDTPSFALRLHKSVA